MLEDRGYMRGEACRTLVGHWKTFCLHCKAACRLLVKALSQSAASNLSLQLSHHAHVHAIVHWVSTPNSAIGDHWPPNTKNPLHQGSLAPCKIMLQHDHICPFENAGSPEPHVDRAHTRTLFCVVFTPFLSRFLPPYYPSGAVCTPFLPPFYPI